VRFPAPISHNGDEGNFGAQAERDESSEGDRTCHQWRAARPDRRTFGNRRKNLRKHYAKELEFGTETLLSKVLNNLASIAIKGPGLPAVSAAKYLFSCRGGDREHSSLHPSLEVETGEGLSGLMRQCGVDAADLRARILDKINAINVDPPEPSICERDKGR
jgi:hypothetical protein